MSTGVRWKRVGVYLAVVYGICAGLAAMFAILGLRTRGITLFTGLGMIYMIVPAAVAVVMIRKEGGRLSAYGVRFRPNRRWPAAWILPILLVALTVGTAALLGFGEVSTDREAIVGSLAASAGLSEEAVAAARDQLDALGSAWPLVLFLQALAAGTTINALFAFGEELGWRGFLQKELAPLGFWRASALIGAIWGFWHTPLTLMGYNFPEHPVLGIPVITLACVPLGILISWVRVRSGSVIPAAIFHGMINALAGYPVLMVRDAPNLLRSVLGISGLLAAGFIAGLLFLARRNGPAVPERTADSII